MGNEMQYEPLNNATKFISRGSGDQVVVFVVGIQTLQGFVPFISPDL